MARIDIYQTVTDTIIQTIEKGIDGNFQLPWHGLSTIPQNAKTDNLYRGVNVPLLWATQMDRTFSSGTWATYRQWQELGAQVRKGQKGTVIVFWKNLDADNADNNQDQRQRIVARWSKVFNADQVTGFDLTADKPPAIIQSHEAADALILASGADIRHGEPEAYYNLEDDYINIPKPEKFKDTSSRTATEGFYSTIFHELTHQTGHKSRLDRFSSDKYSREDYAFEELIAELGAAMICASTGVIRN